MGSLGFSISMIASLSPTLMESRHISSMGCVSTIVAPSLSTVSVVSSSPGVKRSARSFGFKVSMSPSMETTPDSDVGVVSSATTKKVFLLFSCCLTHSKLKSPACLCRERLEITEKLCRCLYQLDMVQRK